MPVLWKWPNSLADSKSQTESSESPNGSLRERKQSVLIMSSARRTHDGGLPAPAVQSPSIVAQAGEASEGEGAPCGGDVQVVLVEQEGNPHAPLTLLPRVVEGDGALPLPVLSPVLKLGEDTSRKHNAYFSNAEQI